MDLKVSVRETHTEACEIAEKMEADGYEVNTRLDMGPHYVVTCKKSDEDLVSRRVQVHQIR